MKPPTACVQCRERKLRCFVHVPSTECSNCVAKGRPCSLVITRSSGAAQPYKAPSPERFSLPTALALQMVEDYIRYLHDRPHSLFHIPTLRRDVERRSLDDVLLLCICSLGCRFSDQKSIRAMRTQLFTEASSYLTHLIENSTLVSVQALILLANVSSAESKPSAEAMYFAMAVRMAQMLRLNERSEDDDPVSAEVKKRIFLSLFMADRWCSFGLALPMQIRIEELPHAKAIDEAIFSSEGFETRWTNDQSRIGLWAYKTDLAVIFGQVQHFIRSVVTERLSPQDCDACADSIASMLMHWEQNLPHDVRLTEANLEAQRLQGKGGVFIDLHLGYHYYSMLLRFPFIGRRNEMGNEEHPEAARCRSHALAFSSLLAAGKSQRGCEVAHSTVGHMTVISSSVLLHNLLSGTDDVVRISRENLTLNFATIVELQAYWPGLTKWVERLFALQKLCHSLSISEAYVMNEWMMRLLLEYELPLGSHPKENMCWGPTGFVLDSQGISNVRQTSFGGDDLNMLLSGYLATV